MRRLWLLRHAQAEVAGQDDFERALALGGREQAIAAGNWLAARFHRPNLLLCSPARRAQQTCRHLCEANVGAVEIRIENRLYEADLGQMLEVLEGTDGRDVLLIAHNPGLEALLAHLLGDGHWRTLPPAGLVELELVASGDPALSGRARLAERWQP